MTTSHVIETSLSSLGIPFTVISAAWFTVHSRAKPHFVDRVTMDFHM